MVRLGVKGLAGLLLLGGCGGSERSAIAVSIEADGSANTTVRCVDTTSGTCHVAFAVAAPLRGEIRKGDSKRFAVGPGTPVCIEPDPVDLAKCDRRAIKQGTQRISRRRVVD
ncbi:hypothetical protein [Sphingomonas psychrotolerans]|nr:hypothetical protein [Sphingomonas psychrotolerans]